MAVQHESDIIIRVGLDENKVPEKISWSAEDGAPEQQNAKAVLLSIWNSKDKETLKIDLWTKDMPLDEMNVFFHQSLLSLSDTFLRATGNDKMTGAMRDFCDYFAEKLELYKK